MKITTWIRPDPEGKPTMRVEPHYENRDTPAIQNYGRALVKALEGGDGSPSEEDKLREENQKLKAALQQVLGLDFRRCMSVTAERVERIATAEYVIRGPWKGIGFLLDCYGACRKVQEATINAKH